MSDGTEKIEARLRHLEKTALTEEEKETVRFLIKVTAAIQGTAWLGGWVVKIAPIIAAIWFFSEQGWHLIVKALK